MARSEEKVEPVPEIPKVPTFEKDKRYRMKVWVNPIWPEGQIHKCMESRNDGKEGLFQCGNDQRWWAMNGEQFEEIKAE